MLLMWKKVLQYKKWLIVTVVIIVAVAGGIYLYKGKPTQVTLGPTIKVERGDIFSMVSATGTISPVNIVDVSSKISGLIEEVKVHENDLVTAGQVLLVLDDTHLQALVDQAKARLNNASSSYERNQQLHDIGAVSDQQLDASRTDYSVAKATYDDAISQLNETVIRAPINGQVIGKPIPAGQAVAPGVSTPMVLLTVADMSKMQIQTQVDESDIGKIQTGQKVTFTVDAYPGKTFSGVVSNVSQKANVQSNVVYYSVLVDVDAADNLLKPTMTARVSISVAESKNSLVVPLAAVKTNNGQQYVMVVQNGKTKNTPVTTGIVGDDKIEILSGVTDTDEILASQVKVQTASSGQSGNKGGPMIPGMGR
ncbi:efflux RND transporter periplasmic adaptor subunit [Pelosinus sp. sgz500959]|uniref:efflux RND transporter periplasmic adaptor subunit n=1 Tax=Pelosinus sp. sgz500959 TaxID=3242472 RepID=UPI0036723D49